jgi:xanthine dehydrogenase accessory factor
MWDWLSKLNELRNSGEKVAIVTAASVSGSTPCEVGAKMLVVRDGRFFGTIGGGHLEELCLEGARLALGSGKASTTRYPLGARAGQCCGGVVDVLIEILGTGPTLYLFGAGHVGQAVCRTLVGTPFAIHAIDERAEWISELPKGVLRHHGAWDDFADAAPWDAESTYVAVMTHRHDTDQDIVGAVVRKPAKYIGLIGSRTKWARFQNRLGARGWTDEELARVRCPIGLPIGGKAPQEVAISVAAELLKTLHEARNESHGAASRTPEK